MRCFGPAWPVVMTAALLAPVLFFAAPLPASAAGVPTSGVAIVLHTPQSTLAPGGSLTALAQIGNATKATVHLRLFPGVATELPNGGYKLEGGSAASSWVKLSTYQVSVAPNKVIAISYRVSVPPHTAPGYYVYGIVSEFVSRRVHGHSGKVGIVVNVNMQNTAPVVVHVPGPTTFGVHLTGWSVSWHGRAGYELATTLKDTGNAYEYVKTHLTLINGHRRTVFAQQQYFVLRKSTMTATFAIPAVDVGPRTLAVVTAVAPHESATASGPVRLPRTRS